MHNVFTISQRCVTSIVVHWRIVDARPSGLITNDSWDVIWQRKKEIDTYRPPKCEICKLQSLPIINVILPFLKSFAGTKKRSLGDRGVTKFNVSLKNLPLLCYCLRTREKFLLRIPTLNQPIKTDTCYIYSIIQRQNRSRLGSHIVNKGIWLWSPAKSFVLCFCDSF